ncbi:MAG: cysteine--tRNA ligase, partial [Oscillospiraceae bacterium]|nr:cysteine--tRNA ligase [Oscillospiraceae bacterium]
ISEKYGYMPIRFFVLSSTYRTPVNFSEEIIQSAKNALGRIFTFGENIDFLLKNAEQPPSASLPPPSEKGAADGILSYREKLIDALCDDFNTADAVSVLFDFIREANTKAVAANANPSRKLLETIKELYDEFCSLFGFFPEKTNKANKTEISDDYISEQVEKRTAAKKSKDFSTADEIRDNLKSLGIILEDTPSGVKWRRE